MALPIVSWPADVWGNIASHLTPLDILQFKILDPKLIIWSKLISPYGLDSLFFTEESHIIPCLTEFTHLRHLAINLPKLSINGLLSLLPSTLQTISFEFPSAMRIWLQHPVHTPRPISLIHFQYNAEAVNISTLFPKLTRFRIIGRDWNQKQEDDPMPWPTHAREAFVRALPPSLTHFEIPSLAEMSSQLLNHLPPMLAKLRLGPSKDFNRSVPLWFIESYWEKICISDTLHTIIFYDLSFTEMPMLPPSLTSLEITTRHNPEGFLDAAISSQPLPRATHLREFTLKCLDISDNVLTLESLQNFPTSITSLSLQQVQIFSSPDSKAATLPLNLISFDLVMPADCTIPTGKIILPKGLTRLSVVCKSWKPSHPYPLELPPSLLEFSGLEGLLPPIPQSVTKLCCLGGFAELGHIFDFELHPRGLKSLSLDVYYKFIYWPELPIAALPPGLTEFQAEATLTVPQVLALPKTLETIVISCLVVSENLLPKNMETLHRSDIERAAIANGVPRCIFTSNFSLAGKPHQMQLELSVKQSPPGLSCVPYFSGKLRHINLRGVSVSTAANWLSSLPNFDQIVSIRTPHLRASSGAAFLNALPKSITSFIMESYTTFDVMAVRSLPEGIRVFHAPQARLLIPPPASLESLIVLEVPRIFWDKLSSIKRVQVGHGP